MSLIIEQEVTQVEYTDTKGLFTCMSCSIAFLSADDQSERSYTIVF